MKSGPKGRLIRCAIFALGGAAGYFVLSAFVAQSAAQLAAKEAALKVAARRATPLDGDVASSDLVAEWNRLRARAQPAGAPMDFVALLAACQEVPDSVRQGAFRAAAIAEWAETDPAAGLRYFRREDHRAVGAFMLEWLRRAPDEALDALISGGRADQHEGLAELLVEVVRLAPARLGELCDALPDAVHDGRTDPNRAFARYARKDLAAARNSAEAMKGTWRAHALAAVAREWGEKDPAAALAWAKALPEKERFSITRYVLAGWAQSDPLAVLPKLGEFLVDAPPDVSRNQVLGLHLNAAAQRDWEGTMEWMRRNVESDGYFAFQALSESLTRRLKSDLPGTLRWLVKDSPNGMEGAFSAAVRNLAPEARKEAWLWLQQHQPQEVRARGFAVDLLDWWKRADPPTVGELLGNSQDSKANLEYFRESGKDLVLHSRDKQWFLSSTERMEALLEKTPKVLHAAVLSRAVPEIGAVSSAEAAKWIARFADLPAALRERSVADLAKGWACREPIAAAQWLATLSAPGERVAAMQGLTEVWFSYDRRAAVAFLENLPQSPERDAGLEFYVGTIAEHRPATAWATALEIQDPTRRALALRKTHAGWRWREPDAANAALQAAGLPPTNPPAPGAPAGPLR